MKKIIGISAVAFGLLNSAFAEQQPVADKLFVPQGFDENDVVEVVVRGHFPDACYKLASPEVKIDHQALTVDIALKSFRDQNDACIEMISPFTQVVNLGKLPEGNYSVRLGQQNTLQEKLVVNFASSEDTDDYLYAPVEYTEVKEKSNHTLDIIMKGRYPRLKRGCMKIVNTITHVLKDIVVIQPVSKIFDDQVCSTNPSDLNFSYEMTLPKTMSEGETLFHVRKLNGESYNRVVDIE